MEDSAPRHIPDEGWEDHFFKWTGRLNRARYIKRYSFLFFLLYLALIIINYPASNFITRHATGLTILTSLIFLMSAYCLHARRLEDFGQKPYLAVCYILYELWWTFLAADAPRPSGAPTLPHILFVLFLACKQGDAGENAYGPDPLEGERRAAAQTRAILNMTISIPRIDDAENAIAALKKNALPAENPAARSNLSLSKPSPAAYWEAEERKINPTENPQSPPAITYGISYRYPPRVPDRGFHENFLRAHGRLNRLRYFKRTMASFGISIAVISFIVLCIFLLEKGNLVLFPMYPFVGIILITYPFFLAIEYCLAARRLEDLGKEPLLAVIYFLLPIPELFGAGHLLLDFLYLIFTAYLFFAKGTEGPNAYGPDPLAKNTENSSSA